MISLLALRGAANSKLKYDKYCAVDARAITFIFLSSPLVVLSGTGHFGGGHYGGTYDPPGGRQKRPGFFLFFLFF